ncbi:MAG: hypothetical protein JWQ36_2954 [Enterovirga sp.]|jgi:hypothetical protein|nr:hypothetical protein [Enterovirga sp.]
MDEVGKLTPQNLLLLLQFVVPGFLAVYFRSLFVRRIEASFKDNILLFVVLSVIYAFVVVPIWLGLRSGALHPLAQWLVWLVLLIIIPVAGGVLLGVAVQQGWTRSLLLRIGLRPLSPYRTGWDWAFGQTREPTYLLVTMDDGSQVAGLFGGESLAASDHAFRDLFLEVTYEVDAEGSWSEREPRQSILVSGKSIRYIEFLAR